MIKTGRAFEDLTDTVCSRCLRLAWSGGIRQEMVMPRPTAPPLSRDDGKPCCRDCAAADGLVRWSRVMTFEMARVVVGNDRQEHLRMPLGMGENFGMVKAGFVRPCSLEDLKGHLDWLDRHHILSLDAGAS